MSNKFALVSLLFGLKPLLVHLGPLQQSAVDVRPILEGLGVVELLFGLVLNVLGLSLLADEGRGRHLALGSVQQLQVEPSRLEREEAGQTVVLSQGGIWIEVQGW